MEVLMEQMENAIKNRPDNPDAWYAVCDALRDDKALLTVDMEAANNPAEYFQSIFPYAVKMADIIHTFETVPVYILVKNVTDLESGCIEQGDDVPESLTHQKSLVITIKNELIPDTGVQIFFSKEDAQRGCREFQRIIGGEVGYTRVPFFSVIDSVFGVFPDGVDIGYLLTDYRKGKKYITINRSTIMSLMLYSTYSLRSSFGYDVFVSESYIRAEEERNSVLPATIPRLTVIRGGKPPVS